MLDLLKIIKLLQALSEAYAEANKDGKITVDDLPKFMPVLTELASVIDKTQGLSKTVAQLDPKRVGQIRDGLKKIGSIFGG